MTHSIEIDATGGDVTVYFDGVNVSSLVAQGEFQSALWADDVLSDLDPQAIEADVLDSLGFDDDDYALTRAVIEACRKALRDAGRAG
jgi:hypothetical protein